MLELGHRLHQQGGAELVGKVLLNRVQFETRRFRFRSSPVGGFGRLALRVSNWTRFRTGR